MLIIGSEVDSGAQCSQCTLYNIHYTQQYTLHNTPTKQKTYYWVTGLKHDSGF